VRDLATIAVEEKLKFVEINFSARFIEADLKSVSLRENIFGNPISLSFLLKSISKIRFLIIRIPSDGINIERLVVGDDGVSRGVFDAENSGRIS
jgi:hypothetical protein